MTWLSSIVKSSIHSSFHIVHQICCQSYWFLFNWTENQREFILIFGTNPVLIVKIITNPTSDTSEEWTQFLMVHSVKWLERSAEASTHHQVGAEIVCNSQVPSSSLWIKTDQEVNNSQFLWKSITTWSLSINKLQEHQQDCWVEMFLGLSISKSKQIANIGNVFVCTNSEKV